jgi:hypothetical protein
MVELITQIILAAAFPANIAARMPPGALFKRLDGDAALRLHQTRGRQSFAARFSCA